MATEYEPSRLDQATQHAVGTSQRESDSPVKEPLTAEDVELAERRAGEARKRAALAGLSAARSFEESARLHEEVAQVQKVTIDQGASHSEVHRESVARHRQAAHEDYILADEMRKESEADLSTDAS